MKTAYYRAGEKALKSENRVAESCFLRYEECKALKYSPKDKDVYHAHGETVYMLGDSGPLSCKFGESIERLTFQSCSSSGRTAAEKQYCTGPRSVWNNLGLAFDIQATSWFFVEKRTVG